MRVIMSAASIWLGGLAGAIGFAGCANDPVYIPGPMALEAGDPDAMGLPTVAKASVDLPIKTESTSDQSKREALATRLAPITVPYVRVGDLEIDVEFIIKNTDSKPHQAKVELNGANEYFSYDPSIIVLDPGNDDAPPTPGLSGNIPIDVPANSEVSGLFTEDNLREAAIDLDEITRGNFNPFRASLTKSKNAQDIQPMSPLMPGVDGYTQTPMGPPIPREAFAGLVRVDLVFKPDAPMVFEYNIRIRDLRGIVHPLLLDAVTKKPGELATFDPQEFNVAAPP
jgi:hypothetical protein